MKGGEGVRGGGGRDVKRPWGSTILRQSHKGRKCNDADDV